MAGTKGRGRQRGITDGNISWLVLPAIYIYHSSYLLLTMYGVFQRSIGNCRNVRELGKSMVLFRLFEKLRYSNERSTKFESLYQEQKYLEEENGKMVDLQLTPKIESLYGLGRQAKKL